MGLDLIEYVMAIEDAFEIEIPDSDAEHLDTPAKLVDYLCVRLGESPDGAPLVQTAFYWLRRAVVEELGVPRSLVRPTTRINELTTRPENDVWKAIAARLEVDPKFFTHAPVLKWLAKLVRAPGRTIGDVAEQLAMLHPTAFKRASTAWTRAQITEVTLRLLEHQVGVAIGPAHLESRFTYDLGMG